MPVIRSRAQSRASSTSSKRSQDTASATGRAPLPGSARRSNSGSTRRVIDLSSSSSGAQEGENEDADVLVVRSSNRVGPLPVNAFASGSAQPQRIVLGNADDNVPSNGNRTGVRIDASPSTAIEKQPLQLTDPRNPASAQAVADEPVLLASSLPSSVKRRAPIDLTEDLDEADDSIEIIHSTPSAIQRPKLDETTSLKGKGKALAPVKDASPQGSRKQAPAARNSPDIEEDITCSICYSVLLGPVNLSCGHVFCFGCVSEWLSNNQKQCPTCRQTSAEPTRALLLENIIERHLRHRVADLRANGQTEEADRVQKERADQEKQVQKERMDRAKAKAKRDKEIADRLRRATAARDRRMRQAGFVRVNLPPLRVRPIAEPRVVDPQRNYAPEHDMMGAMHNAHAAGHRHAGEQPLLDRGQFLRIIQGGPPRVAIDLDGFHQPQPEPAPRNHDIAAMLGRHREQPAREQVQPAPPRQARQIAPNRIVFPVRARPPAQRAERPQRRAVAQVPPPPLQRRDSRERHRVAFLDDDFGPVWGESDIDSDFSADDHGEYNMGWS